MIPCMKKKKPSGQHKAPRKTVQIPQEWLRVAQEMATERQTPVTWLLIDLIKREAESKGKKSLPVPPWVVAPDSST